MGYVGTENFRLTVKNFCIRQRVACFGRNCCAVVAYSLY